MTAYVNEIASGTLGVGESAKWYVWWRPTVYSSPTVFQATPFEGEVQVSEHVVMNMSSNLPPGVPKGLVHSLVVKNVGSSAATYNLWALLAD